MTEHTEVRGSAPRWGPLFGARAADWAQTWEGPNGWGTPVYGHVLDRARIRAGTRVLDCGCGAGRFARMAADRGADLAGIDRANRKLGSPQPRRRDRFRRLIHEISRSPVVGRILGTHTSGVAATFRARPTRVDGWEPGRAGQLRICHGERLLRQRGDAGVGERDPPAPGARSNATCLS